MFTKTLIFVLVIGLIVSVGCSVYEMDEVADTGSANPVEVEIANEGFDTVAYFAIEKATKGNTQFSVIWNGAKWLFSNNENLETFKSDPESFVPQFGAYCPSSIAEGGMAKGKANYWKVVNDKLYLFYNEDLKKQFEDDSEEILKKAKANYKAK